jgi:enoyl-CoA hydratase/carnithine racemase
MRDYKSIIYEIKDNMGWVTLNRPEKLNAINDEMLRELDDMFVLSEQDLDVKVLVIKGTGRAFSTGQDLSGVDTEEILPPSPLNELPSKAVLEAARRRCRRWEYIFNLAKPTIAQVHGHCLGAGMYLALSCDLTVASEDAVFGDPSIRMGILPIFPLLSWLVGVKRANAMLLSGKQVTAKEAERWGLINKAVNNNQLDSEVRRLAKGISLSHSDALAVAKESLHAAMEARGVGPAWRYTSDMELLMQRRTVQSDDFDFVRARDKLGLKKAIQARDNPFEALDR